MPFLGREDELYGALAKAGWPTDGTHIYDSVWCEFSGPQGIHGLFPVEWCGGPRTCGAPGTVGPLQAVCGHF